ncbi:MAG: hypothetical protein ACOYJG_01790 [Prevotella sp.]|jgi:hypothetical protein
MIKRFFTSLAVFAFAMSFGAINASAQTQMVYSYHHAGEETTTWGTGKKEDYDVAIHIQDESLVGSTITGVRIPMPDDISGLQSKGAAFLTKTLSVKSKVNVADVEVDSFDVATGTIEVTFQQPYTITSDGIYVGYTLKTTTDNHNTAPIVVVAKSETDGFWLHTSRTYRKYTDKSATLQLVSALEVLINTDLTDAAGVSVSDVYAQVNTSPSVSAEITNKGCNGVQSVDYTLTFQGVSESRHADLATAIPGYFNSSSTISVELPNIESVGTLPYSITIDKVNGNANMASANSSEANVISMAFVPTKRPLMEEYTGLWCGYCPRGFVGMENLYKTFGDDFCGVAYHNGDPMQTVTSYPNDVPGFPDAWIDRIHETDAYCGDNYDGHYNVEDVYNEYAALPGVADIAVEATLENNTVNATAKVKFPADMTLNDRYQLCFMLTGNGFTGTGDDWAQHNYYGGGGSQFPEDDMKTFTDGGDTVDSLVFNFVLLARSGLYGISNSLPATVKEGEENTYSFSFDLSSISSVIANQNLTYDVIVALLDTQDSNRSVNAAKGHVVDPTGISNVNANANAKAKAESFYSIDGKRLSAPVKGLNIVKMSDGSVKKVIKK